MSPLMKLVVANAPRIVELMKVPVKNGKAVYSEETEPRIREACRLMIETHREIAAYLRQKNSANGIERACIAFVCNHDYLWSQPEWKSHGEHLESAISVWEMLLSKKSGDPEVDAFSQREIRERIMFGTRDDRWGIHNLSKLAKCFDEISGSNLNDDATIRRVFADVEKLSEKLQDMKARHEIELRALSDSFAHGLSQSGVSMAALRAMTKPLRALHDAEFVDFVFDGDPDRGALLNEAIASETSHPRPRP